MLPKKSNPTILPARSYLVSENRTFDSSAARRAAARKKCAAPPSSFGSLLGSAIKKHAAPDPSKPVKPTKKREYDAIDGGGSVGAGEKIDRIHRPLQRAGGSLERDGRGAGAAESLSLQAGPQVQSPHVWIASSRETFTSESWRQRSKQPSVSAPTYPPVTVPCIPPIRPSTQPVAMTHMNTTVAKKSYVKSLPGEVSTNFVRRNLKKRGGCFKSKQPSCDVRANAAALARKQGAAQRSESHVDPESGDSDGPAPREAAGERAGMGGLAALGLDPVQLSLEVLEAEQKPDDRVRAAKEGVLPSAYQRPVFKVSYTETICKDVVSRRTSKIPKTKLSIQEKLATRGTHKAPRTSTVGHVEDDWLERVAPKCSGHQMPASLLVVKKTGANKGRRFYACGFPRDQQCDFFLWAEDNPELLQLISKEKQLSSETEDVCESWRRFALEEHHKRLLNLDLGQLKQAAKIAQMRCRYIHQLGEERGEVYSSYSQRITLSGTKTELITRLTEEAYEFLALEPLLYESHESTVHARKDADLLSSSDCDVCSDDNSWSDEDNSEIIPHKEPKVKRHMCVDTGPAGEAASGISQVGEANSSSNFTCTECPADVCLSDSDFDSSSEDDSSLHLNQKTESAVDHCARVDIVAPQLRGVRAMSVDAVRLLCFGYDAFRAGQRWAIDRTLNSERSLLILPTGAGKSLCFFLPALILGGGAQAMQTLSSGLTIVVSPLISLMEDQMAKLPVFLPGACFSSGISAVEVSKLTKSILDGFVRILFVSPERLCTPSFRFLINKLKNTRRRTASPSQQSPVACLCVDEAHCLSQWSFNFRPSFLRIRREIRHMEPRAVIALTATATPEVEREIIHHLSIPATAGVHRSPGTRYNLMLGARRVKEPGSKNEIIAETLKLCHERSEGKHPPTIIYVWRRFETEVLVEYLKSTGLSAAAYHAGMDSQQRRKTQELFNRGTIPIIVATVAFGMGVDKPNVRVVLHATLPKSVENYLQEIGRAGRDGKPSECFLLLGRDDVVSQYSLSHSSTISEFQVFLCLRKLLGPFLSAIGGAKFNDVEHRFLDSLLMPRIDAVMRLSLSMKAVEQELDIPESTTETMLAILEMSPFHFLEVDGTRYDTVCGRFRDHNKADTVDTSDPLVKLILELNQVKKKTTTGAQDHRTVVDERGFELHNMWDENTLQRDHDVNSSSYGGLEFRVSLLEIANRLCVDPDSVSRSLYVLRKRNILSYSMSNSMVYMTVSTASLTSDIEAFVATRQKEVPLAVEPSAETGYNEWLRSVARRINSIVETNLRCAATRVLDMWRVGNMIDAVSPAVEGHDQGACVMSSECMPPCFLSTTAEQKQKILTDFVCDYYVRELAPKKDLLEHSNTSKPPSSDPSILQMENLFYGIELPVYTLANEGHAAESDLSSIAKIRIRSRIGMKKLPQRQLEAFTQDLRQLFLIPRLSEILELFFRSFDASSKIDELSVKALYMAKIFHGFSSAFLNQQEWIPTGFWGRYSELSFDCIVDAAKICCEHGVA